MNSHKISESERYKGFAKWIQFVFVVGFVSLLQSLPISFAYKLGRGAGWLSWKLMLKRRAVVSNNLEVVKAWKKLQSSNKGSLGNDGEVASGSSDFYQLGSSKSNLLSEIQYHQSLSLETQVKEVFQRTGANLFSGFALNRMPQEQVEDYLQIEGLEHLNAALQEGRGVILLLAHMGPWEALNQLPVLASLHGIKVTFGAMYRPLNNTYLDDWLKTQREASGTRLFSRRDGFHKPVDFIRSGGMLGILADQKMREGPLASYFGKKVSSSPVPGLFHRRSGAPMLAMSFVTLAPARWKLTLNRVEVSESIDIKNREVMATICNQAIANSLVLSLQDGFWLHRRF